MLEFMDNCSLELQCPVLWVFQDYDGQWRLRREGDADDVAFPCRKDAVEAARSYGQMRGAYRLYLQHMHGRFTLELLNTGVAKRRSSSANIEVERTNALSPIRQDRGGQAEFLRGQQEGIDEGLQLRVEKGRSGNYRAVDHVCLSCDLRPTSDGV